MQLFSKNEHFKLTNKFNKSKMETLKRQHQLFYGTWLRKNASIFKHGGIFVLRTHHQNYRDSKEFKSIHQQVKLLESRGVTFNDYGKAKKYLLTNNYYNVINGYGNYFFDSSGNYLSGTTFEERLSKLRSTGTSGTMENESLRTGRTDTEIKTRDVKEFISKLDADEQASAEKRNDKIAQRRDREISRERQGAKGKYKLKAAEQRTTGSKGKGSNRSL